MRDSAPRPASNRSEVERANTGGSKGSEPHRGRAQDRGAHGRQPASSKGHDEFPSRIGRKGTEETDHRHRRLLRPRRKRPSRSGAAEKKLDELAPSHGWPSSLEDRTPRNYVRNNRPWLGLAHPTS